MLGHTSTTQHVNRILQHSRVVRASTQGRYDLATKTTSHHTMEFDPFKSLSSKVNLHHTIEFRAVCSTNLVTRWSRLPQILRHRNPRTSPSGLAHTRNGKSCVVIFVAKSHSTYLLVRMKSFLRCNRQQLVSSPKLVPNGRDSNI